MARKGFRRNCKPLELLSKEEVVRVHSSVLDILRNTGVKFESQWALKFFKKNDCWVDEKTKIVRFPEALAEECIKKAPGNFRVKAAEEENDMVFSEDIVYYQDGPAMNTLDLDTYIPRPPSKQEYIDYIKVLDSLDTVDNYSPYPWFGFKEVPPIMMMPEIVALKLKYSSKFQMTPYQSDCEIFIIEMAHLIGTEILGVISHAAPLTWYGNAVNEAKRMVEAGFPVGPCSGSTFGATGPATILGSITKTLAELISMVAMVQLMKPGHRTFMLELDFPQNMKTGSPAFGNIGASTGNAIFNQMCRFYKLPTVSGTPGFANSKVPDIQGGYERAIATLIAALTGGNIIQLHGCIMGEITGHPLQAIIDDDIAGMVGKFIEGVIVDDDRLAIDLINQVGPNPGNYLGSKHTRDWWQKEQFIPKAADSTGSYSEWEKGGRKDALILAKERMQQIINKYKQYKVGEEKEEELEKVLAKARKYYEEKNML